MNNFMKLPEEYSDESSYFKIYPINYEKNTTFGKGASKGAIEIINASKHLEYYDEQFDVEAFVKGIEIKESLNLNNENEESAIKQISNLKLKKNTFPIFLGGDHSISIGTVKAVDNKEFIEDDFDVIILDAHSDMRHSWNNSSLNHACVAKNIIKNHNILSIGIRSMDIEEKIEIESSSKISIIKSYDYNKDILVEELRRLKKNIYISIDVDVFDPSIIRNTGTPEPGGFFWNDIINILKIIFNEKNVIAADINEFAPNQNFDAEAFTLAKLAYKLMSLKVKYN